VPNRLRWAIVPLAFLPLALLRSGVLAESDTFWQIRTGLDILRTHSIPDADPYSWTARGAEWHPNSWAFDVLLGLVYRLGGLPLVALTAGAFVLVIGGTTARLAQRLGARSGVTAWVLALGFMLLAGWLSARPQLVDYAAAPVVILLLDTVLSEHRKHRILALLGLTGLHLAWVNLHTAAPVGLIILACAGAGHLVASRGLRIAALIGAAMAAAALGCLANPLGWNVVRQAWTVREASAAITEWRSIVDGGPGEFAALSIALMGAAASAYLRKWPVALPTAALALAGAHTIRLLPIACVLGLPALAAWVSTWAPVSAYIGRRKVLLSVGLAILLAGQLTLATITGLHIGRSSYPMTAISRLPASCRLFNGYLLGGPIILLRPDISVSQDSRNDVYGAAILDDAAAVEFGDHGLSRLDELRVTCVITPATTPLGRQLSEDVRWRVVSGNAEGTLFVRSPTPGAVLISG
jgi:hypothetical protein